MSVSKRLVLYLSGFDPRGVRYYHSLYRRDAARQAEVSGYEIEVGKRERIDEHVIRWNVTSETGGKRTETEYLYLEWDDIVRQFWVKGPFKLVWVTMSALARAGWYGMLRKTYLWSWPVFVTSILPAVVLFGLILLVALFAGLGEWLFGLPGLGGGLLLGLGVLWVAWKLEQKFNLTWVGRIAGFHEREQDSELHMLDRRRDAFAQLLRKRLAVGDVDEVLVVGHSYGAPLAIQIVARALDAARTAKPRLSLLTLGQTIMWFAWLPRADDFRAEIAAVAESNAIDWIDVSAPPDGACFALVDPYTAIGDRRTDRKNPKLLNAKFHETIPAERLDKRTRNWMELHFQYIMATTRPGDYDYFAITAGPESLAERFAHRLSVRDFIRLRRGKMQALR